MDESVIRETYASMSDEALLDFTHREGGQLTPEALGILKSEFASRGLDASLLVAWEQGPKRAYPSPTGNDFMDADTGKILPSPWAVSTTLWEYVIEEKAAGASDAMILEGLTQQGLTTEAATAIIDALEEVATARLKRAKDNATLGACFCIGGIILTIVTFSAATTSGGTFLICWGPVIFGGIRWNKGITQKRKCEEVLAQIDLENGVA